MPRSAANETGASGTPLRHWMTVQGPREPRSAADLLDAAMSAIPSKSVISADPLGKVLDFLATADNRIYDALNVGAWNGKDVPSSALHRLDTIRHALHEIRTDLQHLQETRHGK